MHSGSLGVTLTKRCRRPILAHVKAEELCVGDRQQTEYFFVEIIVCSYLNIYLYMQNHEWSRVIIQLWHKKKVKCKINLHILMHIMHILYVSN